MFGNQTRHLLHPEHPNKRGAVYEYLMTHIAYIRLNAYTRWMHDDYWREVYFLVLQLDGMVAGYNNARDNNKENYLNDLQMWMLSSDGDLETIIPLLSVAWQAARVGVNIEFNNNASSSSAAAPETSSEASSEVPVNNFGKFNHFHCSAMLRLTENCDDFYMSHDTWDSYGSMLRTYKHYNFMLSTAGPRRVSFSSSPGYLSSVDDFLISDKGLVVTETTNGIYNTKLFSKIEPTSGVMSWMRSMIATNTARTGPEWIATFSKHVEPSYNNGWLVFDARMFREWKASGGDAKFRAQNARRTKIVETIDGGLWHGQTVTEAERFPNYTLPANLLVLVEQVPGFFESADVTPVLARDGYYASYNVPFFKKVHKASGFTYLQETQGDEWSHDKCARARMFRRDSIKVQSIDDMKNLMTYNDYLVDPISEGNPGNTIASRFDLPSLAPPTHQSKPAQQEAFGSIDCKITTWKTALDMQCIAQSGPTHSQQEPFSWSHCDFADCDLTMHKGQLDRFDFDFVPLRSLTPSEFLASSPVATIAAKLTKPASTAASSSASPPAAASSSSAFPSYSAMTMASFQRSVPAAADADATASARNTEFVPAGVSWQKTARY
jgi:hypothetical protein